MKYIKGLAIFNTLTYMLHVAVAYFVQQKMFNEKDVGEVSAIYPTLFTPAGFTFGIWGIIYTALGIFCLYHLIITYKYDQDHPSNTDVSRIGFLFIIVQISSACWLVAWTNESLLLSVLLIIIQLACLAFIHSRLNMYNRYRSVPVRTFTQFPISIYLGWISIATIANMSSFLTMRNWNAAGFSESWWMVIMLSLAIMLALYMVYWKNNFYFGLVVTWALYGIISKLNNASVETSEIVLNTAWLSVGVVGISSLVKLFSRRTRRIYVKGGDGIAENMSK